MFIEAQRVQKVWEAKNYLGHSTFHPQVLRQRRKFSTSLCATKFCQIRHGSNKIPQIFLAGKKENWR